jgi:hypothetical protein
MVGQMMTPQFLVHNNPVWRQKADFIIHAPLEEADRFEQLWARKIGSYRFELCCIPAYAYNLALGDIVVTGRAGDSEYVVQHVDIQSGHYGFRAWLGPFTTNRSADQASLMRDQLVAELQDLGALTELVSPTLLAIDTPNIDTAQLVADYLAQRQQRAELEYETARQ